MEACVAILCTGNEILDGRVEDSNSRLLSSTFDELGVHTAHILACRDDITSIRESIAFLLARAPILIISGGLGPTSDDLTREAVSEFLGKPLYLDQGALENLKALYQRRKRIFDISNTKQAQFPEGSKILENPVGTAAGFHCQAGGKHILVVPGVPHELKRMTADHLLPFLQKFFSRTQIPQTAHLHIFGRPESKVGELVERGGVPPGISISYRAHYPEIIVKFSADRNNSALAPFVEQVRQRIGADFIFSELSGHTFDRALHELLIAKQKTVAVAESCTGGMLGALLAANGGASAYFQGGAITYSNDAKSLLLNVPPQLIANRGAVSHEVACSMAENARRVFSSDVAVSITGIAGPGGGSAEKPVGTFFIGFSSAQGTQAFHCFASASRTMIRTFASYTALDIVRRHLLGYDLRPTDIIGNPQSP